MCVLLRTHIIILRKRFVRRKILPSRTILSHTHTHTPHAKSISTSLSDPWDLGPKASHWLGVMYVHTHTHISLTHTHTHRHHKPISTSSSDPRVLEPKASDLLGVMYAHTQHTHIHPHTQHTQHAPLTHTHTHTTPQAYLHIIIRPLGS